MSNPLRQRYRALTLPAPQPFVMLSEWIFLNLFNAKRAPRRSKKVCQYCFEWKSSVCFGSSPGGMAFAGDNIAVDSLSEH